MAKVELLAPLILKWEGGYTNDIIDPGGATNMGVTLSTWHAVGHDKDGDGDIDADDIKLLTKEDFITVLKIDYWDRWRADFIKNQSIANTLTDWVWASGDWGIKIPQRILGVTQDGRVGSQTINAVNAQDPQTFFTNIYNARVRFLNDIVENSIVKYEAKIGRKSTDAEQIQYTSRKFIHGWLNRLNDFKFSA